MATAVETMLTRSPRWFQEETAQVSGVLFSQCTLSRNLSDFPFPLRCTEDEKQAVVDRVVSALDSVNLLSSGTFYSLADLDPVQIRFLAERRLLTTELITATGPRGVYVSDDQSLSIVVNGDDHLALRALKGGAQLQDAWARLDALDNSLGSSLDFAFHDERGYLTSSLDQVGTGLKAGVVLHLPATVTANRLNEAASSGSDERLTLGGLIAGIGLKAHAAYSAEAEGVERIREQSLLTNTTGALCGSPGAALGELFYLVNRGGLGQSEDEIVFQVGHIAATIEQAEQQALALLVSENVCAVQDRAGRALGMAAGAYLLSFSEALSLLSSIRCGVAAGTVAPDSMPDLNELTISSQGAHLEIASEQRCDALTLNQRRADLFRDRFARK